MNQKEAVKLAVMDEQIKNIAEKLDIHIQEGKDDSVNNKKAQEAILKKLDDHMKSMKAVLELKANKSEVDKLDNKVDKINRLVVKWSGAIAVIVFIIGLIVANIDKILGGLK